MRKLLIHPVWLFLALAFTVLVLDSCKKEITSLSATQQFQPLTIGEAQQHFEKNVKNNSKSRSNEKHPEWDGAKMRTLSNGNLAVMVPLNRKNTYIAVSNKKMVKYGFLNYAMMYKDSENKIVTEWVELKPSDAWFQAEKNRPYDGGIVVKNWNGKIKKILVFDNGTYIGGDKRKFPAYSKSMTSRDDMVCLVTRTLNVVTKPKTCVCENHTYEQINLCTCDFGKPAPGYTTTILVQVEASCDAPIDPDVPTGGQNEDGTPREGGTGNNGGGRTSPTDYPPLNCNPDPNYQVPTVPPPPGTEYVLPCSELGIIAEDIPDIPDDSGLDVPTTADLIVFAFNSDPDPSIHLSTEEVQFLYQNPVIVEELKSYLFTESQEAKEFGKWVISYLTAHPNLDFEVFKSQFLSTPEGQDDNFDVAFWDDPNNAYPPQSLPSWADFQAAFPSRSDPLYNTSAKLYQSIGGDVLAKVGANSDANTCAARLSKALNYSGVTIPNIPNQTFKGSDGKYYFLGAEKMNRWMRKTFGCANPNTAIGEYLNANSVHVKANEIGKYGSNLPSLLNGITGIYSLVSSNYRWATGHADIMYSNATCDPGGSCHFDDAPIKYIDVWKLQ